jgi:hypothetical protein
MQGQQSLDYSPFIDPENQSDLPQRPSPEPGSIREAFLVLNTYPC